MFILTFLMNVVLICYCHVHISEHRHIFREVISYHNMILLCILFFFFSIISPSPKHLSRRRKTFTMRKCYKIFSGDQRCQCLVKNQCFGDYLCLHHQGRQGWSPKKILYCLPMSFPKKNDLFCLPSYVHMAVSPTALYFFSLKILPVIHFP
jgi:hypothetical protein